MKTIKQLREEYDNNLTQILPEDLVLEASSTKIKKADFDIPSFHRMPSLLMFRRVTYRRFPDNQTVALYYSKTVDKYLSIPFGPTGNLNLGEATMYDTLDDFNLNEGAKWQAVKGGIKGAVQGAAKGLFKGNAVAAEPGMAIGAVVGGIHGAYKGAKKAYQKAKETDMKEQSQDDMERTTPEQARKEMENIRNMWTSGTDAARRKEGDDSNSWSSIRNPYVKEDWSDKKHQNPSGGLKKSGVMAYRRENPGSKLQTAVTTKPSKLKPGSKAANRRKSFCARMGGMKKRLTSAKTANDPDSRINKALRKWNCEEAFRAKLQEKRQERIDEMAFLAPLAVGAGEALLGAAARTAVGSVVRRGVARTATRLGTKLLGKRGMRAAKDVVGAMTGGSDNKEDDKKSADKPKMDYMPNTPFTKAKVKSNTPQLSARDSAVDDSRRKSLMRKEYETSNKQVSENKISDIRAMIQSEDKLHEMTINGRTVTLNSSMAKRILEVYDSVNTKNKKIVEGMLNEDLESFKKLLNFSIRN